MGLDWKSELLGDVGTGSNIKDASGGDPTSLLATFLQVSKGRNWGGPKLK